MRDTVDGINEKAWEREMRRVPETERKAGDRVTCPKCGVTLVLIKRLGLWACDPGTNRRHGCLDDRR